MSCEGQHVFPSIEFDSCFADYADKQELNEKVGQLSESLIAEQPNYPVMAVVGCMHYQLGQRELSEQHLTQAFNESEDEETKGMSAAALGLIHLKDREYSEVRPYIEAASKNHLGRWMIVLYYIDYYRDTNDLEYLRHAVDHMKRKNKEEGATDASDRFLRQIQRVHRMAENCSTLDGTSATSDNCVKIDFREEKISLFAFTTGFLKMLLKEEPFNTDRHDNSDDESNTTLAMN